MLDISLIRENPEKVRQALLKRMESVDFTELMAWDKDRRALMVAKEELQAKQNRISKEIPAMKKAGQDISGVKTEMQLVRERISELQHATDELDGRIEDFMARLPNIPAVDVKPGGKENNEVVRSWGVKPEFIFKPRDHVELVGSLGLVDYDRGVKMGGSGFWLYTGNGARLEWALLNYFVQEHLNDGYTFMLPPHILTSECGYVAGQFPKFADDVFHLRETDGHSVGFLLPTSETALINFHRNEILREDELPRKYFAYTPCYRREAGSYRTAERGMIRGHQFNKVEIFQYTRPEDSENALEEMLGKAERLVQGLGIHHRVSKLAAMDCSASMAKTFDVEVWIPSMNDYKEASSASNAGDYQARRGKIRFKRKAGGKIEFIHTLNASGLATSRLFPALLEQFQQPDGSVLVPEPLRKWVGKDVLTPLT